MKSIMNKKEYVIIAWNWFYSLDMAISSCIHFSVDDMDVGGQGEFHIARFLFLAITASINPGVQVPLLYVDSRDSDLNICVYHLGLECSSVVEPFLICIRYQIWYLESKNKVSVIKGWGVQYERPRAGQAPAEMFPGFEIIAYEISWDRHLQSWKPPM